MADDTKKTPAEMGKTKDDAPTKASAATTGGAGGGDDGGDSNDGILNRIIQNGKLARDPSQIDNAKLMLAEFANQIASAPKGSIGNDVYSFIVSGISKFDRTISSQLDEILHDPDFQKFEGSWRGIHKLVQSTETSETLKLKLWVITKQELFDDLDRAVEFDQSQLFKKVYEEQYGTFGGIPFSCLLGDFEFGRDPVDMELATLISNTAACAHTPFIAAAAPALFNFDSFTELSGPRDLSKLFDGTDAIKWRSFRDTEDSRYFVLTLPHVLMRLPYGKETSPVEGFDYEESVDGTDNSKFCWGSSAYAMGQNITNAFALYKWTAAIRGVEGGGLVADLPAFTFKTAEGDLAVKCPTEVAITDRREKELSDLGFIALCYCKDTDYAAFFSSQTTQKPKEYNENAANANSRISARLPYMLNASRFAHYIKAMMRDKIGSFFSRQEVSLFLNSWIAQYVLLSDVAPETVKASFPLREARIDVSDVPGKPGSYTAVVYLRPFFQLEELTASLRLVATLPRPGAG
ncbi:MAG TPA: type VI secretion system contractile sheath large subunit [Alphaproteobacteria bacterium]|nr:type VI secretion system contractile sheath large subunit [Alphaproteobacteria bacterium]